MIVRRITAGAAAVALGATAFAAAPAMAAKQKTNTTVLTLDSTLVGALTGAGVTPSAIGKAKLKGAAITFPAKLSGKTISHKGGLKLTSAAGFVSMEKISINTKNGKASAFVKAPIAQDGLEIADILVFKGGKNKIKKKGTWTNAKVSLATTTSLGDPAPLLASALGLPATAIPSGVTLGKANVIVKK
ncbi:MAG: hypothetical protein MUF33_02950 [Candidatus Nanopelagicales bacterium]|jgi:hypothetical protein|nr:hypothetical protein [Candidatus Nanopelagicales bacterium]